MKKICLLLVLTFLISLFSGICAFGGSGNLQVEVLFSENFEGDLSRWCPFYGSGVTSIDEKEEFVNCYLEMTCIDEPDEFTYLPRFESIPFEVSGGETYTVAADMMGKGKQTGYLVFLDEKGHRLDNMGYKFFNEYDDEEWHSAYSFVEAPEEAKKASVILLGNVSSCNYDNVLVCKGRVGFSSKYENRKERAPIAEDNSLTEAAKLNIVFSETFENKIEGWTHTDKKSQGKVRITEDNASTGNSSLLVKDDVINRGVDIVTPLFDVTEGANYEFSADIYKKTIPDSSVEVSLNFYDENGVFINSVVLKNVDFLWKKCSVDFLVPQKAVKANVIINSGNGSSVAYVDNIYVIDKTVKTAEEIKLERINQSSVILIPGYSAALLKGERVLIDEDNAKVVPLVINSRTMLPVRFIAQSFGFSVFWDEEAKTVSLIKNDKQVKVTLNEKAIDINGESIISDTPALSIEGRTMLPLRILCEKVLGKQVFWDNSGLIVISDEAVISEDDNDIIEKLISKLKDEE